VLHLDVYDQQEPVLYQEVYGPQQPLLHLGVAVFMSIFAAPGPVYKNHCYTFMGLFCIRAIVLQLD
jgi:hypothetical protein